MAIPSPHAPYPIPLHGPITAEYIFGKAGKKRTIMRHPGNKRWTIKKCPTLSCRSGTNRFFKNSIFLPPEIRNIFKLVVLDEIDSMTVEAQGMLRQTIEKNSTSTRFCLICNDIDKIKDPLKVNDVLYIFQMYYIYIKLFLIGLSFCNSVYIYQNTN